MKNNEGLCCITARVITLTATTEDNTEDEISALYIVGKESYADSCQNIKKDAIKNMTLFLSFKYN
jgi:predicted RNA-binding protein